MADQNQKAGQQKGGGKSEPEKDRTYKIAQDQDGKVTLNITGLAPEDKVEIELKRENAGGEEIPKGGFRGGSEDIAGPDGKVRRNAAPDQQAGVSADCAKTFQEIQTSGVNTFKDGGDYVNTIAKEWHAIGKECGRRECAEEAPPQRPAQQVHIPPPPQEEPNQRVRWWIPVLIGAGILALAGFLWCICHNSTEAAVEPCCTHEYIRGQKDAIDMAKELKGVLNGDSSSELIEDHDESGEDRGEGEDAYEDRNTSTGGQFGEFRSADPDLTLQILAYLTSSEDQNFRYLPGDSTDGENKFLLSAAQIATLMQSNKGVRWRENRPPKGWDVYRTSYNAINQFSEAGRMASLIGQKAKYRTAYKNEESFEWWVNSAVQEVPSSSKTDFSEAVKETIDRLMEKVQDEQIPSINGKVIFAVNHTSNAGGAKKSTTRKKSSGSKSRTRKKKSGLSPLNMETASYGSLNYIRPIPAGYRQVSGGKFGVWRSKKGRYHYGEDLAPLVRGRKDLAVNPAPRVGVVISAKTEGGLGKCVRLDIGDAEIIFAHLDSFGPGIKAGKRVRQGEAIGNIGQTGGEYGVHLHIEFVPKVSNFIVPIFIEEEQAGAYSSGLSRF